MCPVINFKINALKNKPAFWHQIEKFICMLHYRFMNTRFLVFVSKIDIYWNCSTPIFGCLMFFLLNKLEHRLSKRFVLKQLRYWFLFIVQQVNFRRLSIDFVCEFVLDQCNSLIILDIERGCTLLFLLNNELPLLILFVYFTKLFQLFLKEHIMKSNFIVMRN